MSNNGEILLSDLKALKKAYNKAVKDNVKMFKFKDETLVTGYAKYAIEYLEMQKPKK